MTKSKKKADHNRQQLNLRFSREFHDLLIDTAEILGTTKTSVLEQALRFYWKRHVSKLTE